MNSEYKTSDIDVLLYTFRESAQKRAQSLDKLNYKEANKNYDLMENVYREIKKHGIDAQIKLLELLKDDNPWVKLSVASRALEFAPESGVPILENLSKMEGSVGFSAEITLEIWRKGELKFT